jgi:hypothetical protein
MGADLFGPQKGRVIGVAWSTAIKHYYDTVANQSNVLIAGASVGVFFASNTTTIATDSFTRANQNPINTNWKSFNTLAGHSGFVLGQVLNNQYVGQAGSNCDMYYSGGIAWPNDQFSQATLVTLNPGKGYAGLYVRVTATSGYLFLLDGVFGGNGIGIPTGAKLFSSGGQLAGVTIVPHSGDVFRLTVTGTLITVTQNGNLILSAIDSSAVSGDPGILASPANGVATDVAWVNWSGGGTPGTGTVLAPIFSDDGITPKPNPTITDALGRFDFFVADGRYNLQVSGAGLATTTQQNVEISDITESQPSDSTWATAILNFTNQAGDPPIPPVGTMDLYTKEATKHIFVRDDSGLVTDLMLGGGGGPTPTMDTIAQGGTYTKHTLVQGPIPLLDNGNFELGGLTGDPAPGWFANSNATISLELGTPFDGLQSLKMQANNSSSGTQTSSSTIYPCSPGDVFYISGAMKTDGVVTASLNLSFENNLTAPVGTLIPPSIIANVSSTAWTQVNAIGTVPAGATVAFLSLQSLPAGTAGTTWWDAISVYRVNYPGPLSVGQGLTVGSPITSGLETFVGSSSGQASIGVANAAGTPNSILLPTATGSAGQVLTTNGGSPQQTSWTTVSGGGGGGVSSVGLSLPPEFVVSNSPVTSSGVLTGQKAQQAAGTVYAGPAPNSLGGAFDGQAIATGLGTTSSLILTPSTNHDLAFFLTNANASCCSAGVTMPAPWVNQATNGNQGAIFTNLLSTAGPVTGTATFAGTANWTSLMFLLEYTALTTPAIVQGRISSGGLGNGSTISFSNPTTIGNTLLAVFMSSTPLGGGSGAFTDSQANNWIPLLPVQNGGNSVIYAGLTSNIIGATADTITFHTANNFVGSDFLAIFELSNINFTGGAASPPSFRPIQISDLPLTTQQTAQIFSSKNLGGNVPVTANTLTTIDSLTVTMPATGGPWRARVTYSYYKSGGINYNSYVTDGTNNFAGMDMTTVNNDTGLQGTQLSPVTYPNGQSVTFTTKIFDTGTSTVTTASNIHTPSAPAFMQVEVISSN